MVATPKMKFRASLGGGKTPKAWALPLILLGSSRDKGICIYIYREIYIYI